MKMKKEKNCTGLSVEILERMADTLKLLAHPQRLKIVEILDVNGSSPVHVVADELGLPPAATSQHLNKMKRVGLINADRRGKEVWYSVGDPRALTILGCIRKSGGCS